MAGQVAPQVQAGLEPFSSRELRTALGAFATGVTVITTQGGGRPYGMTASSFTSVSLDPPLVLVCIARGAGGSEAIAQNGVFAVNILGERQEAISRHFASRDRSRDGDAFQDIPHQMVVTGSPVLDGVAGYLDCRLTATHEAGDHLIFVGEVLALGVDLDVEPLVFHHSRYRFLRES